jgi:tRNA(Ile)-lysidine synthase
VPAASRRRDDPITADEAAALFAPLAAYRHVALAVSGGADSTALMWLAARARKDGALGCDFTVLTVDHGLRAASAGEALVVAGWALALGLPSVMLKWKGEKPLTGLQAAARAARYRLMDEWRRANGADAIVTAHTLDDQAETLLMRLARGSGLHGLAAMRPRLGEPWPVLRPLLDVPRARLVATLKAAGHPWIDDPSNDDPRFERVRLRALMPVLADAGLGSEAIALAAKRLARADAAIEAMSAQALAALVVTEPAGFLRMPLAGFNALPEEVRLRTLQAAIGHAGGGGGPADLSDAEAALAWLAAGKAGVLTIGGAWLECRRGELALYREPGRLPADPLPVEPGRPVAFDHRFVMVVDEGALRGPLLMRPVGSLKPPPRRPAGLRAVVWATLPCLADGNGTPLWLPAPGATSGPVRLAALAAGKPPPPASP